MDAARKHHNASQGAGQTAAGLFQQQWTTYRKIVDNNYLFHREAYAALRQCLQENSRESFSFLDLACGDAASTVEALRGTAVSHYRGVDLSEIALREAERRVETLGCAFDLQLADFTEVLMQWSGPAEIVWIGLSLHHFLSDQKLALMREIRRIVGKSGKLMVYENTSLEDETRQGWLARWDRQEPNWPALTPDEWRAVTDHVHQNDHPETARGWFDLGEAAGFQAARILFVSPTSLFRLFEFRG